MKVPSVACELLLVGGDRHRLGQTLGERQLLLEVGLAGALGIGVAQSRAQARCERVTLSDLLGALVVGGPSGHQARLRRRRRHRPGCSASVQRT
jgi:hypothetical protein